MRFPLLPVLARLDELLALQSGQLHPRRGGHLVAAEVEFLGLVAVGHLQPAQHFPCAPLGIGVSAPPTATILPLSMTRTPPIFGPTAVWMVAPLKAMGVSGAAPPSRDNAKREGATRQASAKAWRDIRQDSIATAQA